MQCFIVTGERGSCCAPGHSKSSFLLRRGAFHAVRSKQYFPGIGSHSWHKLQTHPRARFSIRSPALRCIAAASRWNPSHAVSTRRSMSIRPTRSWRGCASFSRLSLVGTILSATRSKPTPRWPFSSSSVKMEPVSTSFPAANCSACWPPRPMPSAAWSFQAWVKPPRKSTWPSRPASCNSTWKARRS